MLSMSSWASLFLTAIDGKSDGGLDGKMDVVIRCCCHRAQWPCIENMKLVLPLGIYLPYQPQPVSDYSNALDLLDARLPSRLHDDHAINTDDIDLDCF